MDILAESDSFVIAHEYETAYALRRDGGARIELGNHYGDPTGAMVSPDATLLRTVCAPGPYPGSEACWAARHGRVCRFASAAYFVVGSDLNLAGCTSLQYHQDRGDRWSVSS